MRKHIVLLALATISLFVQAQNEYEAHEFTASNGNTLSYRLLRPETEKSREQYPVVLFLHGAGERGTDNQTQLTHGGQMFLNPVNREKYPAFVLFPQCPEDGYWAYHQRPETFMPDGMPLNEETTPLITTVKELLDSYITLPQTDSRRIYIIGLSMGGMGTFDMAIRFPETFAAAVPICGSVNPARLTQAKEVSFRIFHGDNDDIVPVEGSRAAYKALKATGASVEYIEFPGVNHGSWNPAFNHPDFMEWLFSQRK